jgi:3-hydroxyisobutyrate dehydrogenase-like beta-hydroxyacid dehydrogenase
MAARVGVVGLGVMGSAMSGNLMAAGFTVVGFDIDSERMAAHARGGGEVTDSPASVADTVDTVVLSLPSVAALEAVVRGDGGLLGRRRDGLVVLETSTLPLEAKFFARDGLAPLGVDVLDCPLSGTGAQARVKDVIAYVSGAQAAATRVAPVLEGLARRHFYTGEFGNGSKLKYIANLLVTIHNLSTAEAFLLAQRAGLDARLMLEVIGDGAGASRMFQVRGPLMVERDYADPTMRVELFQKDIEIIRRFAQSVHSPTPLFTLSAQFYEAAMAQGRGAQDPACVFAVLEQLTESADDA